jgi:hypothetical protein
MHLPRFKQCTLEIASNGGALAGLCIESQGDYFEGSNIDQNISVFVMGN